MFYISIHTRIHLYTCRLFFGALWKMTEKVLHHQNRMIMMMMMAVISFNATTSHPQDPLILITSNSTLYTRRVHKLLWLLLSPDANDGLPSQNFLSTSSIHLKSISLSLFIFFYFLFIFAFLQPFLDKEMIWYDDRLVWHRFYHFHRLFVYVQSV